MNENLFSYGTLQDEKVQMELFGRTLKGFRDSLEGYKLSSIVLRDESFESGTDQNSYYIASMSKDKKDIIEGMVLEVSEEELRLADEYEPEEYKRVMVILKSGKQAWVYVAA